MKVLPVRSRRGPLTAGSPQGLDTPLSSGTRVATHFPIEKSKGMRHYVANIGQAQEHQRYTDNRIKYGGYFTVQCFRSDMSIT